MIVVRATLYDPVSGLRGVETYTTEAQYEDSQEFLWNDGNYSCDCNRRLFLCRLNGLDDPEDEDDPCGHTIKLTSLIINGVEVLGPAPPASSSPPRG